MPTIISIIMPRRSIVEICEMAVFCGKLEDMRGCDGNGGQFFEGAKGRSNQAL
ncbi:hypothetical protein ACFQ3K_12595 [Brucella gallinifaecis]|uniref:hypothetical protein n=1 Tax=Brucella gallinifaecis TaxID=215590 RepID=UPI00130E37A2|nr:hypothetical protein [Brucella gallinifaecis]